MAKQILTQNKLYQWCVITLLIAYPAFVISVLLFPLLFVVLLVSILTLFVFELTTQRKSKNWLLVLCFSWLLLAVPTFGVMPILIAFRWHLRFK